MRLRFPFALACAVALAACGGKGKDKDDKDEGGDEAPAGPPAFGGLGGLGAFSSLLSQQGQEPGPYDEPEQSPDFDEDDPHVAVLELSGPIVELQSYSWFGGAGGVELRALLDKLRALAAEDDVTGLVVRLGDVEIGPAAADELRAALVAFKAAGGRTRTLHCHAEQAADAGYTLLTACDHIALAPEGGLSIGGPAAVPIHVKGLLDKLGVRADFVHVGDFKGGPEPLTHDRPSRETVQTLEALIDTAYRTQVAAIAEGRALSEAVVRAHVDRALFSAPEAVEARLADDVAVYEAFLAQTVRAEWRAVKLAGDEEPGLSRIMEFLGMAPAARPGGPHVALVYAVGNVVDGEGEGLLGARGEIASRTLAAALRALARDDAVRAVVLRIDSPGGSALASEQILHAVEAVREHKPVVVSMGEVAASGGYYIGCRADRIFAQPNTITGSIGVFGGKLVVGDALASAGVGLFPIGKGKRALLWSMVEPWTADERAAVRDLMEQTYRAFVGHVAAGRGKSKDDVHAVAQGRVWSGADALARGLVDELGGLDAALADARARAELPADAAVEIYPPEPTLADIVGSLGEVSLPPGLAAAAAAARQLGPREAAAVERVVRQLAALRDAPVQAALVLPLVR